MAHLAMTPTKAHSALGMLGWISTNRPDVAYAYSRIGQHHANLTDDAMDALYYCFQYLSGSRRWCLSGPLNSSDISLSDSPLFSNTVTNDQFGWEFYVDTDFAGNADIQNKRKSRIVILALLNTVPVYWRSSVSSVGFAREDIGAAHAV